MDNKAYKRNAGGAGPWEESTFAVLCLRVWRWDFGSVRLGADDRAVQRDPQWNPVAITSRPVTTSQITVAKDAFWDSWSLHRPLEPSFCFVLFYFTKEAWLLALCCTYLLPSTCLYTYPTVCFGFGLHWTTACIYGLHIFTGRLVSLEFWCI